MSNDTKILDDILYHGLRPWLDQNAPDEKFAAKLSSVKEETPAFQFKYEIDFLRPFNHKTKYYAKLIINEATRTSNHLYQLINEDDNNKLKKYWLNDTLNKKLRTRIKDIGKIIKKNNYSLIYVDPKKTSYDIDQDHKSNTYIIQLLKIGFIQVYLEIQTAFSEYIDDVLILDDFYTQLLFEPLPENYYLKQASTITLPTNIKKERKNEESNFQPCLGEVPNCKTSKASYDIIRNPNTFAEIETKLYEYGLIDIDYNFIKNKRESNSRNLAAIIKVLIDKNYFRRNILGSKKLYKDIDIREYLENRYNTDIKQQFRKLTIEQKDAVLSKYHWLDRLIVIK